jgi:hypothetical protein
MYIAFLFYIYIFPVECRIEHVSCAWTPQWYSDFSRIMPQKPQSLLSESLLIWFGSADLGRRLELRRRQDLSVLSQSQSDCESAMDENRMSCLHENPRLADNSKRRLGGTSEFVPDDRLLPCRRLRPYTQPQPTWV